MKRRFLKQNLTLVIGISLPVLVVIIFAMAAALQKKLVSFTKFDLLYMTMPYPHDGVSAEVIKGKLQISITPAVRKGALPMPRLFRFIAKTQSSKEIPLELPARSQNSLVTKKEVLEIPEIKNLKLDPNAISPDGYKVEFSMPNYGNAVSFFISTSYKRSLTMSKGGNTTDIIDETNNTYGDKSIKFLGWIIPD